MTYCIIKFLINFIENFKSQTVGIKPSSIYWSLRDVCQVRKTELDKLLRRMAKELGATKVGSVYQVDKKQALMWLYAQLKRYEKNRHADNQS